MQRLYDILRRHPTGVDAVCALLLLVATAGWTVEMVDGRGERLAVVPVALGLCLVITFRRKFPRRMLLLAIAVGLLQLVLDVEINPLTWAMLLIVYTNASFDVRWASQLSLAMALIAPAIAALCWPADRQTAAEQILSTVFLTVTVVMAWVLGDLRRTRRAYYEQLEERAARLEREREAEAKVAVAAERARIVRELHDVVAHNVSAMVVQADGGAHVLNSAPEQTRNALETISCTGRQALADMRRLLGVLRTGDVPEGGEYVPQPGVDQLSELIDQVRRAGLHVEFTVEGTPRPLPSSVELTAYRIVQEALANTRKHGGPDAGATVRLTYSDGALVLLAEDDGRGEQGGLYGGGGGGEEAGGGGRGGRGNGEKQAMDGSGSGPVSGPGHGLIGMRERVGMVGGRLDAGPRPDGGFRISAVLPLKAGG